MAHSRPGNLPVELTSFVGRRDALGRLKRSLEEHRAVTLTGTGGVGKSKLALHVAHQTSRAFPDGVWFVELDDVSDEALLPSTVLAGVGLRDDDPTPVEIRLVEYFRRRQALLLLDGCDRVVEACAYLVNRLLHSAPGLRVLTTSRRPLRIAAEVVLPVQSLATPDSVSGDRRTTELARFDAVALFVDRAVAVRSDFTLTEARAAAVARICHRLDGLPMAIELAANRVDVLSVEVLAERIEDAYGLLVSAKRGAPPRQRTLRALVDSSYELCSADEQLLWARSAVFTGRFDLDAVTAVCAGGPIDADSVLDLVAGLVDKSVLTRDEHPGGSWYRLPHLLRDYAREQLIEPQEWSRLRQRHAQWCLSMGEQTAVRLLTPGIGNWVDQVRGNHANIRSALEFCLGPECDPPMALRLAAVLRYYWIIAGRVGEGRAWLDRGLRVHTAPTSERAAALGTAAYLAVIDGYREGREMLSAARAIEELLADPVLGGDLDFVDSLIALQHGDLTTARVRLETALEKTRSTHDPMGASSALGMLSLVCVWSGDTADAQAHADEYLQTTEGDTWGRAFIDWTVALNEAQNGAPARALAAQRTCATLLRSLDDQFGMALCLQSAPLILASDGRHHEAALLLGAQASHSVFRTPIMDSYRAQCAATVEDALGSRLFDELTAQGQGFSLEQAIGLILERPTAGEISPVADRTEALSRREWEVADLIAQGRTNKDIAASLVISARTAEGHVQHILAKLDFSSRAQIAVWMTERRGSTRRTYGDHIPRSHSENGAR
ncbi:LuxR C-terminal-related transcriptional regulator [Streptomyces sp. NPDC006872]|uniref:ATP-binding protein n=1 Tax=Streptomyces sp. NPDC006872 TaxID=3155720 RepID=UPI0033E26C49